MSQDSADRSQNSLPPVEGSLGSDDDHAPIESDSRVEGFDSGTDASVIEAEDDTSTHSGDAESAETGEPQLGDEAGDAVELDMFAQLEQARESQSEDDLEEDGVSLEELSQAYAAATGATAGSEDPEEDELDAELELFEPDEVEEEESEESLVNPRSILESVLYVGKDDGSGFTAKQLAKAMRGVNEKEVQDWISELNTVYQQTGRAMRFVERSDGYHAELAEELEFIRERFYGRTREVALNQSAIDCLALIAYQPGISRDELEHQRGQPSGGVLNQLVRRQLVEIHRSQDGKKKVAHYHPTEKLLELAGLASLEDLPQVEDLDVE